MKADSHKHLIKSRGLSGRQAGWAISLPIEGARWQLLHTTIQLAHPALGSHLSP